MSNIKPFDVVVLPFPYSDNVGKNKRRPAVVVSCHSEFHQKTGVFTVAMITSSPDRWPLDISIHKLKDAGLHVPCVVRMKLFTLEQAHIIERIGSLASRDRKALIESLQQVLVA